MKHDTKSQGCDDCTFAGQVKEGGAPLGFGVLRFAADLRLVFQVTHQQTRPLL